MVVFGGVQQEERSGPKVPSHETLVLYQLGMMMLSTTPPLHYSTTAHPANGSSLATEILLQLAGGSLKIRKSLINTVRKTHLEGILADQLQNVCSP